MSVAHFEWYFMLMLAVTMTLGVIVMTFGVFYLIYMGIRDEINNRRNDEQNRKKGYLP